MHPTDRAIAPLRRLAIGAALLLAPAPALRAEDTAALFARAPALPLSAPVTPLSAPVEVATEGWGPFRRLCVYRGTARPGAAPDAAADPPFCLTMEAVPQEGGVWQLLVRTVPRGPAPAISFTTSRDARGSVGPVSITIPEGVPPPTPQQLAQLQSVLRATIDANGMGRGSVTADAPFILPLTLEAVAPDLRVEGGGFTCRAEGRTTLEGRDAIVATCTGRGSGRLRAGRQITIDMAGRFAIDVPTGMVLRHGYASFLVMTQGTPNETAMELRTTSRLVLE